MDLQCSTQLIIFYTEGKKEAVVGMSHILCDGYGFLQYLYLLTDLYNGIPFPII